MTARPNAPSPLGHRTVSSLDDATRALRRLETCVGSVLAFPPLASGFHQVELTVTGIGTELVDHGLGRPLVGYTLVRSDAVRAYPALLTSTAAQANFVFGTPGTLTLLVW